MELKKIIKLAEKNIKFENLEKTKNILEKDYYISYGIYDEYELKKAIHTGKPFFVDKNFIIGYKDGKFINDKREDIIIDKMIKAIIIEDEIEKIDIEKPIKKDLFAIIKETHWDISDFRRIFENLYIGEIFLPPHSAVFNFLNPTEKIKNKKIASMLSGININIYFQDNYIDNCFHEIGHLFWRNSLNFEEKNKFNEFFKNLKPSAIYDYEWERHNAEEVFCTIYKWYLKSILINRSFYNILEFEEPYGLRLLEDVFDRIKKEKMITDIFEINKDSIYDYLNPKIDATTGNKYIDSKLFDRIKDIQLPVKFLQNIDNLTDDVEHIKFENILLPVKDGKILFENLKKANFPYNEKPIIYMDMDGVVADFKAGYKNLFDRDVEEDDIFTINQFCQSVADFFLNLPVIHKGFELFDLLKDKYKIIFLTNPMNGMNLCRINKIEWAREHFPNTDIIFSENKYDYVIDEKSILVDDMEYNLKSWRDAGGTAINFNKHRNDKIIDLIDDVFDDRKHIEKIKNQLEEMDIELNPTEKQKESGNYKKGDIVFKSIKIKIENPKGSIRWGIGENGKKWINKMKCHYGYIVNGQDGIDGDKVDVFLGDKLNSSKAFIVNQFVNGIFDEHKIILGVDTIEDAEKLYLSNYQNGWDGLGSIKQTNTKKLREWLKDGNVNNQF